MNVFIILFTSRIKANSDSDWTRDTKEQEQVGASFYFERKGNI